MMMTGLDFLGEKPFEEVYIHATVLDAKGERMSKSKGNGIDPIDLIEQYGADAVRFSLLQLAGKNQDFRYSEERVKLAAAFCNKFWNASRFVLTGLGETPTTAPKPFPEPDALSTADRWILSRLNQTIEQVNAGLASYDMDDAMRAFYAFFWDEFCDWYVELTKPRLRSEGAERETAGAVLTRVLETTLRLTHPMMPFVTEEIWQAMRAGGLLTGQESADSETLLFAPYPQAREAWNHPGAEERMTLLIEAVRALRNLRAELGIAPGNRLRGAVVPRSRKEAMTFTDDHDLVAYAARLAALEIHDTPPTNGSGTERWVGTPISGGEVFLEIGDALDMPKELERIAKELAAVEKELVSIEGRLGNAQFLEKAAPAIVEKTKAQAAELAEKRASLEAQRALFGGQ
jgi:valyl-tRNA synthetase